MKLLHFKINKNLKRKDEGYNISSFSYCREKIALGNRLRLYSQGSIFLKINFFIKEWFIYIIYIRSGADTPRIANPLAIVIFTAFIKATRADVKGLFDSSRTFSAL